MDKSWLQKKNSSFKLEKKIMFWGFFLFLSQMCVHSCSKTVYAAAATPKTKRRMEWRGIKMWFFVS